MIITVRTKCSDTAHGYHDMFFDCQSFTGIYLGALKTVEDEGILKKNRGHLGWVVL